MSFYLSLPNYANNLRRSGFAEKDLVHEPRIPAERVKWAGIGSQPYTEDENLMGMTSPRHQGDVPGPATDTLSQNEHYIGQRLMFQRTSEVETELADVASGEDAKRILRRSFGGAALIAVLLGLLAALLGVDDGELANVVAVLATLVPLLWLVLTLALPRTEPLGDWNMLLDGKSGIAETAYGVVFRSLQEDHAIPAEVQPRRMRVGPPVRGVRNVLRVRIGKYYVLVSCFAFGNDLYMGWTLWRRQFPFLIVLRGIGTFLRADRVISGLVEMEPIKAMRESVHDALRRGIEAAVVGVEIPMAETFGYEVPIEEAMSGGVPGPPGATPNDPPLPGPSLPGPPPRMITLSRRVEVFSPEEHRPVGNADPGVSYEVIDDTQAGLLVRDKTGAVGLVRDRSAVQGR